MIKQLKINNFIFPVIIAIFFTSCKFQDIEIGAIQSIDLNKMTKESILINLVLPIQNPNNFKITVKDHDMKLDINGQDFDVIKLKDDIVIPKKYDGPITVPLSLSKNGIVSFNTIKTIYKVLSDKQFEIKAEGTVKIKVLLVSKKIDINEKRTIKFKGN